ncbi:MAG: hypothetical protein ACLSWV_11230, partial [Pygmaiobacter massiliensis]
AFTNVPVIVFPLLFPAFFLKLCLLSPQPEHFRFLHIFHNNADKVGLQAIFRRIRAKSKNDAAKII